MDTIANFPFFRLEFTKDGRTNVDQLLAGLGQQDYHDLLVLSHGWNNDNEEAHALYEELMANSRKLIERGHRFGKHRKLALVGVFWPSKKFTDDALRPNARRDGGIASAGEQQLETSALVAKLERLAELLDATGTDSLLSARSALERIDNSEIERRRFTDSLLAMLPSPHDADDELPLSKQVTDAGDALEKLREPIHIQDRVDGGGVATVGNGGGGGHGDDAAFSLASHWSGIKAGAWRLLNYATYYVMKERAGHIGRGLNGVLARVRSEHPSLGIHLVGHSFGARVVTAAVAGEEKFAPKSLTLLQGAFSHNGFAPDVEGRPGHFRNVIVEGRVTGPIVSTHTRNDKAVGIAYAIASRLSGDSRSDIGDAEDLFGGIGRNGAVRMAADEVSKATLQDAAHQYPAWKPGRVTNLLADSYVANHGDVRNSEVANALLAAMA